MSTDYLSTTTTPSDHDLILAIPGDVESVRMRLLKALDTLGYKILGEQPIYAKRSGVGSACQNCSLNVLDYPTTLTISLKQMNDVAVVAVFNYEVKSYMHMTKGDRQTLAREAEALAALATERLAMSACPACGTQITDESHFCRRCGAPLIRDVAELEVLRLTRGSRNSYHNIFVGVVTMFLAALTALPLFIVNGARISGPFFAAGLPLGTFGLVLLLHGIWQLHRTLNPKAPKSLAFRSQPAFAASTTTALPPVNVSVTEGTTELLSVRDRRVAEPIRRDANTAEIDNERPM
jgi:hypothetical protein